MTEVQPLTLAEFLLARIDDDEEQAGSGWERVPESRWSRNNEGQNVLSPDAILAECEAKRRIVEMVGDAAELRDTEGALSDRVLLALVQPYADHADFRDEWRR